MHDNSDTLTDLFDFCDCGAGVYDVLDALIPRVLGDHTLQRLQGSKCTKNATKSKGIYD